MPISGPGRRSRASDSSNFLRPVAANTGISGVYRSPDATITRIGLGPYTVSKESALNGTLEANQTPPATRHIVELATPFVAHSDNPVQQYVEA